MFVSLGIWQNEPQSTRRLWLPSASGCTDTAGAQRMNDNTGDGAGGGGGPKEGARSNGGAGAPGEDDASRTRLQASRDVSPKRSKTEQVLTVDEALVGGATVRTTLRLDQFPSDWWRHLVRYLKMVELVRLHLTCTDIRVHALPSKCLCVYLDSPYQLQWLQECQASVERVIIRFCAALHDPTQVVTRLGTCTSLKEWHFEQHPRGVTNADHTHLTAPIQVVVSQLTQLQTFLQQQPRYVCLRWRRVR